MNRTRRFWIGLSALLLAGPAAAGPARMDPHYVGEDAPRNKIWLKIQEFAKDALGVPTGAISVSCFPCPGDTGAGCAALAAVAAGTSTRILAPSSCSVRYLKTETDRAPYLLTVGTDKKLYGADRRLFDTAKAAARLDRDALGLVWNRGSWFTKERWKTNLAGIYVITEAGQLYVYMKHTAGYFNHSSFLAGAPVLAAGEIAIKDGLITHINNQSGHYKPTDENLLAALTLLGTKIPTKQIKREFCQKGCGDNPYHHYVQVSLPSLPLPTLSSTPASSSASAPTPTSAPALRRTPTPVRAPSLKRTPTLVP